jgi:hypothetical protein
MENAELIKALRQCRENGNCDTCEYNTGDNADCIDTMMADAADALEAADKRVKELEERIKNAEVHADCMEAKALALEAENADLRNELCLLCGKYKTAHLGSCDGCRWKKGME